MKKCYGILALFCVAFLNNTNLVSQKSQLAWKLIYTRHASNYIHETGTYRVETQGKAPQDQIQTV